MYCIIKCSLKTDACVLCSLFLSNLICFHAWLHFVSCSLSCFLSSTVTLYAVSNLWCGTLPNASRKSKCIISTKFHLSVMSVLSSKNSNRLFKRDLPWLKLFWPPLMNYTLAGILLTSIKIFFSLTLMLNYVAYNFLVYLLRPFFSNNGLRLVASLSSEISFISSELLKRHLKGHQDVTLFFHKIYLCVKDIQICG